MVKYRYALYGLLAGVILTATVYLNGWHRGFDVGYGAAMSDALLNLKNPEDYFKQLIGKPDGRCHGKCDRVNPHNR